MKYFLALACMVAASGCTKDEDDADSDRTDSEAMQPIGSYDIDAEDGTVRATHRDGTGLTTTMEAGQRVSASLPDPFALYPGATVTNTTVVQQGKGTLVVIEFETPDPRDRIVEYYRAAASRAAIEPDVDIEAGATTTLAGSNNKDRMRFALQVTRAGKLTTGQINVSTGLD